MNKPIDQLPALGSVSGDERIPVRLGGTTYQLPTSLLGSIVTDRTPNIGNLAVSGSPLPSVDILEATGTITVTLPTSLANKWGFLVVANIGGGTVTTSAPGGMSLVGTTSLPPNGVVQYYKNGTVWRAF